MNIAILLPYKENFSKNFAGAVSIFVNDTNKLSKFYKTIKVYGFTEEKNTLKNYQNINLKKKIFQSTSSQYLKNFNKIIYKKKIDILEIHNRPHYIDFLNKINNCKKILYFHNDPLNMQGSITKYERENLIKNTDKIIFNSYWSKSRYLIDLDKFKNSNKLEVVHQSTSRKKINFSQKKKIISFIGKLNSSKGYDVFGKAIVKILDKYNDWSSIVIGDEPRQKHFFNHKNLHHLGFKNNSYILKKLETVSISVVPSKWDEPFGRSSMEAASRGCALIKTNTGGLSETTDYSLTIKKITPQSIFNKIEYLIKNHKIRFNLQRNAYKNFSLTNKSASNKLDKIRVNLSSLNSNINTKKKNLKILHITNFNERFDGRLHYNTGKRINNGLIRHGYDVLNISDRDIISNSRTITDPKGIKILNKKIISSCDNFNPDIILMGHADNIELATLDYLKNKNKSLKIAQWFLDPVTKHGPDYTMNKKRFTKFLQLTDANFLTTDPNSLEFDVKNTFYMPNPSDKAFETLKNYNNICDNDLFFAMSHGVHRGVLKQGKYDNREKILNTLIKRNKKIKFDFYGFNNIQPIWGNEFLVAISKSKMGLNLSRGKPAKYYSSDRIAQLMGNGLLTFIDEKTCFSDFFSKNELITYKNLDDLSEKIMKFKIDDKQRRKIAMNGKIKYLRYFNSDKVTRFMINTILDINKKEKFIWN